LAVDNQRANVLWLDDALGALLDKLREHGLEKNTLVFFFNDHGQRAKGTLYQGGVRNPSIIWRHASILFATQHNEMKAKPPSGR